MQKKRFLKGLLGMFFMGVLFVSMAEADNLIKNPSFEEGLEGWVVPGWIPDTVEPIIDKAIFQGPGNASVKMIGEEGKRGFLQQSFLRKPEVKKYRISGWIKIKDFENSWTASIYVECIGKKGWLKMFGPGTTYNILDMDWKKFELEFEVPEETAHLGVIVVTMSPTGKMDTPNRGTVWFDNICLEELVSESNAVSIDKISPLGEQGIFLPEQSVEFALKLTNGYNQEKEVILVITTKDFYDKIVYQKEETLKLKPLVTSKHQITIPPQKGFGFYGVNVTLKDNSFPSSKAVSSFCILSSPETRDPFFGICWFYMHPSMAKAVRLMGAGTVGDFIYWNHAEKEKGKYDFSEADEYVDPYLKEGFRVIGGIVVLYAPGHTTPDWIVKEVEERKKEGKEPFPPEYFEAFGRFMEKVVNRYKDRIKIWSFIGEIELVLEADPSMLEHYVGMIKAGYAGAKRADPTCIVGGVGVSGVDGQQNPRFPQAKKIWQLLYNHLDGMFFDAYVSPNTFGPGFKPIGPERGNFKDMLLKAKELIAEYGKNKLAIDEKGDAIITKLPVDSPYAKDMAKVLSRNYIIAKSVPEVDRYLHNPVVGVIEGDQDFGLWKRDEEDGIIHPRPLVASYATTARFLANTTESEEISLHNDVYCYVFKKKESSVAALWTVLKEPVSLLIELPGEVQVYNLMGNKVPALPKGKQELILTDAPFFLVSASPAEALTKAISNASFSLPLIKGEAHLDSLSALILDIANQTDRNLKAKVEVNPLKGTTFLTREKEVLIPSGKVLPVEFQLIDSEMALLNKNELSAKITIEGRTTLIKEYLDLYPVIYNREKIVIDGDLTEYKNIFSIILDNLSFLSPVDAHVNGLWTSSDDLSCKVWLTWDSENFYFAAQVTDDKFIQERTGGWIWANDSFQISFDTLNDALSPETAGILGYDTNDYEYGIALTKEGPQIYCWVAAEGRKELQSKPMDFPLAIKRVNETSTNYELAIPWKYLSPLEPEKGKAFGINFIALDVDRSESTASYWLGLTRGIAGGKEPSAYKTFILIP